MQQAASGRPFLLGSQKQTWKASQAHMTRQNFHSPPPRYHSPSLIPRLFSHLPQSKTPSSEPYPVQALATVPPPGGRGIVLRCARSARLPGRPVPTAPNAIIWPLMRMNASFMRVSQLTCFHTHSMSGPSQLAQNQTLVKKEGVGAAFPRVKEGPNNGYPTSLLTAENPSHADGSERLLPKSRSAYMPRQKSFRRRADRDAHPSATDP